MPNLFDAMNITPAAEMHHFYPAAVNAKDKPNVYRELRDEFIHAMLTDPQMQVTSASYGCKMTAADVILDNFSGVKGEEALHELLRIVALASGGVTSPQLHLRASAWIAARAHEFADFSEADAS